MSAPEIARIERGWSWLRRFPSHRRWEDSYAQWLRWIDGIGEPLPSLPWSAGLAPIVSSLAPGFVPPANLLVDAECRPCSHCGTPVWSGEIEVIGGTMSPRWRVGPERMLLNPEPSSRGRWIVRDPGFTRYCPGIVLTTEWPLPRYASHLVTCPVLIAQRKAEREIKVMQMRDAGERRKQQRAKKEARIREAIGA